MSLIWADGFEEPGRMTNGKMTNLFQGGFAEYVRRESKMVKQHADTSFLIPCRCGHDIDLHLIGWDEISKTFYSDRCVMGGKPNERECFCNTFVMVKPLTIGQATRLQIPMWDLK